MECDTKISETERCAEEANAKLHAALIATEEEARAGRETVRVGLHDDFEKRNKFMGEALAKATKGV